MRDYLVIPMGEILSRGYDQQKIENALQKFSCHREVDLENFLINKAIPYEKSNFGKTYLFLDNKDLKKGLFTIMAYFTIAQRSVDMSQLSNKRKRKVLGNYPGRDSLNSIPAFLIGQLGRCDEFTNNDLSGQRILDECYHAISLAARIIGGNLLILECREHMFERFYEGQGFIKLYDELNEEGLYTLYKKINFSEYWNT